MRCVSACALALHASAAFALPPCPPQIDSAETLPTVPAGWSVERNTAPRGLSAVSVFDGPPGELASLRPEEQANGRRQLWRFTGPSPRGIWVACLYDGSRLMLTRRIEPAPRLCELITDARGTAGGAATPLKFDCR